ncbi:hypothetical protein HPB47_001753 [Ixodes persulcatus]|uniref:Uncharacterized protein n=1 Tax=Ixodes persulcatus TaxID=34615 RepID=A0AC60PND1_IXOPE|nr:hypothetical protein HPB47_001753 [Ixodes persulcatus]
MTSHSRSQLECDVVGVKDLLYQCYNVLVDVGLEPVVVEKKDSQRPDTMVLDDELLFWSLLRRNQVAKASRLALTSSLVKAKSTNAPCKLFRMTKMYQSAWMLANGATNPNVHVIPMTRASLK